MPQRPESKPENGGNLHEQADRCRRLAQATYDRQTNKLLSEMAEQFQRSAEKLARRG